MLIKLLLILVGSGSVVGVTYSQIQKDPSEKTVVVSNNHESKLRANMEKTLDSNLLKNKKKSVGARKKTAESRSTNKESEFNKAKEALITAYKTLNTEKEALNVTARDLKSKYDDLITKDNDLKTALITKMQYELDKEHKKLNKEFYEFQTTTLNKEKDSIKSKIQQIDSSNALLSDICATTPTFVLSAKSTPPTAEETAIEEQLKKEITTVCDAITQNTKNVGDNNGSIDSSDYETKNNERDGIVNAIRSETQKYNLQIIKIKSAESEVQMKLLKLGHAEKAFTDAKIRLKTTTNELEMLDEQVGLN